MKQGKIKIGSIDVPVMYEDGICYYPTSYVSTKVLLRNGKGGVSNKGNKDKLSEYLKTFTIEFSEKNIQKCQCISEEGLKVSLASTQHSRLSTDQKESQNELHKYLGINLLSTNETDIREFNDKWFDDLDEHTINVYQETIDTGKIEWYRCCSKCNKYYPMINTFYAIDKRAEKGFSKVCKKCLGVVETFTLRSGNKMMTINDKELIKESYKEKINNLYNEGYINKNNLTMRHLYNLGLGELYEYFTLNEIYQIIYGNDFYLRSWEYPNFRFEKHELTYEIANEIIKLYLIENSIMIKEIFNYDYRNLAEITKVISLFNENEGYFIVQFYNFQYAYYKFGKLSLSYYKNKNSIMFDLRYLIEKDLKIDILDIPIRLTKTVLLRKCRPLYYRITNHTSMYKLINKMYPDKFTEEDFEMSIYEDEFDSDEECLINDVLIENFENVVYNQRNTIRTVKIDKMIPDWLIYNDDEIWIVEYFGLYQPRHYNKNKMITNYINNTHRKIEKYKKISDYKYLFLYPEDMEKDFKGVKDKIIQMKNDSNFTML